jgi:hypothetical protein
MKPDISIRICGKKFRIFDFIDFEIIAFEGKKKVFLDPDQQGQQALTPVGIKT